MNIFDNVNNTCVAQEGATNKARELISSKDFKTAIQYMKIGINKKKKEDYKAAIKAYENAKDIFINLRSKAQKLKVYPVSVIIGSTIGFIATTRDIYNATSEEILNAKQRAKIDSLSVYALFSNMPIHQVLGIPLSKAILYGENKKADKENPAKIANSSVAAIISFLNVYISACDDNIDDIKLGYESDTLKVDIVNY